MKSRMQESTPERRPCEADRVLALTNGNAAEIRLMLPGYSLLAGRRLYPVRYIPEPRSPSQPSSLA
eukprot:1160007-Pelagomonas_calceolata.AAC.2